MVSILEVARLARSVSDEVLRPFGYVFRSSGTKQLELTEPLDAGAGYWERVKSVANKPPRWILHLRPDASGRPVVSEALDGEGKPLPGATTPGYINNGLGICAIAGFRIILANKIMGGRYKFVENWEWVAQFVFASPLPPGTSGDILTEFSPERSSLHYKGRSALRREYEYAGVYLHPIAPPPVGEVTVGSYPITYARATSLVADYLGGPDRRCEIVNLTDVVEREGFRAQLSALYEAAVAVNSSLRDADEDLYVQLADRITSGERGFITPLAAGVYRVAPPLAISGTSRSSTGTDTGDAME